jgi:hypothetical protein
MATHGGDDGELGASRRTKVAKIWACRAASPLARLRAIS